MGDEVSRVSVYAVAYRLEDNEWVVHGTGWSEVHLFYDAVDASFRLVAWTVSTQEVLFSITVTSQCSYAKKTNDFHRFVDGAGKGYGFGFFQSDDAVAQSNVFKEAIEMAIEEEKAKSADALASTTQRGLSEVTLNQEIEIHASSISESESALLRVDTHAETVAPKRKISESPSLHSTQTMQRAKPTGIPLGKLEIRSPRRFRESIPDAAADAKEKEISDPIEVDHKTHVTFDPLTRKYHGLPEAWENALSKQFGLNPADVESVKVDGYASRIPAVLVQLKRYLIEHGGLQSEGIFRIAPDGDACAAVKRQLEQFRFESCDDINIIANLIKVFFREMPVKLLQSANPKSISTAETETDFRAITEKLKEPENSWFTWLLDLCIEVALHAPVNRMTARNLAIVIAPNTFDSPAIAPMDSLLFSQKMVHFMHQSIEIRARDVGKSLPSS